ncbi:hypothetical protein P171DRAFT_179858 [Karstenula rhodostoma CBS 690.94]|uniref:Uncharacterized protein n=1 Tax=Karstenula rhodostoma CBS 690.94 TaxID=1392251 RepID=A0A9P4P3J3_9PLEO|nr:hypothetical protein P171DRAFT_179858 [Karstenula rhodostoma CBS 690.94]
MYTWPLIQRPCVGVVTCAIRQCLWGCWGSERNPPDPYCSPTEMSRRKLDRPPDSDCFPAARKHATCWAIFLLPTLLKKEKKRNCGHFWTSTTSNSRFWHGCRCLVELTRAGGVRESETQVGELTDQKPSRDAL